MPFDDHTPNFAYSLVATAPSPATTGTSLVVTAGQGVKFPTPPFNATIWPASTQPLTTNAEIVRVTAISTDTLTIKRAQESSTARTVIIGDQIAATVTAKTLTDVEAGFSPDLALTGMTSPRDNVITAATSAYCASDFECGGRYGSAGTVANLNSLDAGFVYAVPVTLPTNVVISAIYVLAAVTGFAVSGNMRVAIYNDSAGAPTSILYQPAAQAYAAADLVARFAGPTVEVAAGSYWLAVQMDTTNTAITASLTENTLDERAAGMTYGAGFPDPFGTPQFTGQSALAIHALAEYATEIGAGSLLEIG